MIQAARAMLKSEKRKIFFVALLWVLPLLLYYSIQPFLFYGMPDGDVYLYHRLALQLLQGQLPFVDYYFEYPPASVLIFAIPAFVTTIAKEYVVVYQILSWAVFLIINFLVFKLFDVFKPLNISKYKLFLIISLISFTIIQLVVNRFDTFASLFMMLGTVLFIKGVDSKYPNYRTYAIIALILGTLIKLYPLFLLPFFGLYELKNFNWKTLFTHTIASFIFSLPFIIWMVAGYQGLLFFLSYHSGRGLEIESTWSSFIIFAHQIGGFFSYDVVYEYASLGINGQLADMLAHTSLYVFVGLLFAALVSFVIKLNHANASWLLLSASLFVNVGFAALNKVFSAQYIIWFVPLLFLYLGLAGERIKHIGRLQIAKPWRIAGIITFYITLSTVAVFPFFWGWYVDGNLILTSLLFLRNLILLVIAGFAFWQFVPDFKTKLS